ncbi:hypothetical protein Droror1_Dr00004046 [Drosera rotundifolia]
MQARMTRIRRWRSVWFCSDVESEVMIECDECLVAFIEGEGASATVVCFFAGTVNRTNSGEDGIGVAGSGSIVFELGRLCLDLFVVCSWFELGNYGLFSIIVSVAEVLGKSKDKLIKRVLNAQTKLPPTRIAGDGSIMEWSKDFQDPDIHHRQLSHLFGLFPGHTITPEKTQISAKPRLTPSTRGA